MKRIISIAIVFVLSIANAAFAAEHGIPALDIKLYNEAFGLLSGLSVISENSDEFAIDKPISRGRFAKLIADCMKQKFDAGYDANEQSGFLDVEVNHEYYKEISYLKSAGLLNGDGSGYFRPDDSITFDEVKHLMLVMLGYCDYIQMNGGFPGGDYKAMSKAAIKYNGSKDNTCRSLLPLIVKCLEGKVSAYDKMSVDSIYYTNENTINGLEMYFDVRKDKGVLQACGAESIIADKDIGKGRAVIDHVVYNCKPEPDIYIGASVEFYYKISDNDVHDIIMISPSANGEILEIPETDLDDFRNMTYHVNGRGKIKVTGSETIVYNSSIMTSFNEKLMIPNDGRVVFIDNNGDGDYDVIRIYSYESFVVASVVNNSDETFTIYPKSAYNLPSYQTDVDISKLYDSNGKEISFNRIKTGNSVSIYSYLKNDRHIISCAYVTDKKLKGDLTARGLKNERTELTIDDTPWRVSDSYNAQAKKLELDLNYIFYVDYFGNIIGVDGFSPTTMAYGYLLQVRECEPNKDDPPVLKIYSEIGSVVNYMCADRVYIDDVKYKPEDMDKLVARLCNNDGVGNIIRYSVNSEKEIIRIDLWENMDYDALDFKTYNRLKLVNPASELYLKRAYKNFGGRIKYDDSTRFFLLPSDNRDIEDGIRIVSFKDFKTDGYYEISSYTSNTDSMIPEVCLLKNMTDRNSGYASCGVVTKVAYTYDKDTGDYYNSIRIDNSSSGAELLIKDDVVLKSLPDREVKKGDIIKFFTNYDGFIDNIKLIYRADGDKDYLSQAEAFTNGARFAIGNVFDKDDKYVKIHFGELVSGTYPLPANMEVHNLDNFKKIIVIDASNSKILISSGTTDDISTYMSDSVGSKVVLNTEFGEERSLYIIKR